MTSIHSVLGLALLFTLLAAAWDLRTGHIPNRLTFTALLSGGALQVALLCWSEGAAGVPFGAAVFASALVRMAFAVLACGLVPYLLFLRGGMGGGDVKLLAAVGACLGPLLGLEVELYAFAGAALFACAWLAYQGQLLRVLGSSAALLAHPLLPQARRLTLAPQLFASLRFGPAVFAAVALVSLLHWRSR